MDWLDNTLNNFEENEKQRKEKEKEDKAKLIADLEHNREQVSIALKNAYTSFSDIKKKLESRKYPCEAHLASATDAHSGKQFMTEAILVARNKPLLHNAKLEKTNSPYISFRASHGSDNLTYIISLTDSTQPPSEHVVGIKQMTKGFIEGEIEKFIIQIFK